MEYHLEYDPIADALYIRVRDDKVHDTIEVSKNIIVDLNDKGEIIGIEILNFSKSKISLNELVTKGIEVVVQMI